MTSPLRHCILLCTLLAPVWAPAAAPTAVAVPPQSDQRGLRPMLAENIDRPLRYTPVDGDFVITNGAEFFNRPLYGGASAFRVDAGDQPEFSLFLPGRGGNLRLGFATPQGVRWLHQAARVVARYRPGAMLHEIQDPLLAGGVLRLHALAPRAGEGLILRIELAETSAPLDLVAAFGGIDGERGRRDGDIGTERLPVREFFRLQPEYCRGNTIDLAAGVFLVRAKAGSVAGIVPAGGALHRASAIDWENPAALLAAPADAAPELPVVVARVPLAARQPVFLALQRLPSASATAEVLPTYREVAAERDVKVGASRAVTWQAADLPALFAQTEADRQAVATRVSVETPDPFLNTAVPALNIAADGVWDDRQKAYLHGGVAWRVRLLGWRVAYAGDALGWHDRTRAHFTGYAERQNTSPVPAVLPSAEESARLSRHETALHSSGDLTKSHYDMNLVGIDTFFRHLLWTGDLAYARRMWPVLTRHLEWERRLFRREFGPERLPLYEAYCCIWASDDLAYNGGGATHSSAYNLYHHRQAARLARLLGLDPAPYQTEADLIARGIEQQLWLPDRGWYAEWKDLLGRQLVHPQAAAWTFYHTVDSEVSSPLAAWQMTRYVDTALPHLPLRGPGVPAGGTTIATTNWMPYTWSLNNVVLAETVHTALGFWQANRPEAAYALLQGALLDSMYVGICPGNVGMCTWLDANPRERQRDFGDGVGILARTLVEGVFGVLPDLLAGEVRLRPGFPAAWPHASLRHPDFDYTFRRHGETETHVFTAKFGRPVALQLELPARRDRVAAVTVNGRPVAWRALASGVGLPRLGLAAPAAGQHRIEVRWSGDAPAAAPAAVVASPQGALALEAGGPVREIADPQGVLDGARCEGTRVVGTARGTPGHRTVFAQVEQGDLSWWQPLALELRPARDEAPLVFTTDWRGALPAGVRCESVPLGTLFNDRVSQIFRHDYVSPRSPFCSLATPRQGFGSWCKPDKTFVVDDTGLRAAAAAAGGRLLLPNGVPLATPAEASAPNVAFVSQWDNFPRSLTLPLSGRARKAYLLVAGSTSAMQSRCDNGEIVVQYTDGTATRLPLHNPTTWWPIDQDYFIDHFAFARPGPLPVRVDLKTGQVRVLDAATFRGGGREIPGGAATVLDLALDAGKELKALTLEALANEVVIGLMSVTLQRP